MKKTLVVFIALLLTMSVFFCVPVSAVTSSPTIVNRKTFHATANGVAYTVNAVQFYPHTDTSLYSGSDFTVMITYRIYNGTSQDAYISGTAVNLVFDTANMGSYVVDVDNLTEDLFISDQSNGFLTVSPSNNFSRYTGIKIPSYTSLYLVATVKFMANFNTSNASVSVPSLYSCAPSTVVPEFGDYFEDTTDIAQDLSSVVTYLNTIEGEIDDVESLLTSIKNELIPNANFYSPAYNPPQSFTVTPSSTGLSYMYAPLSIYSGTSYIAQDTIDHFDEYHTYTRVIPITIAFLWENYYDYAVYDTSHSSIYFYDLLPDSEQVSYEVVNATSDVFNLPRIIENDTSGNATLIFDYKMDTNLGAGPRYGLVPIGKCYSVFTFNVYVRGSYQFSLNTNFTYTINFAVSDIYLKSTNLMLSDIYNSLNSNNSSNISTDSGTLHTQSDQVHSQEATYYAQNTQAIQATGLSNYQFDNSTVSGLQGIRSDFTDVWNALSGWNSIYIFSLTLGLALTILRHSPSAISSAIRRKRYNNNE